jgi:acetoin utilization deacetylase AcuC-like enzyme
MKPVIITCYRNSICTDLEKYGIERNGTNRPELRQKLIMDRLSKYDYEIAPLSYDTLSNEELLKKIHDHNYIDFLKEVYTNFENFNDEEYKREDSGIIPSNFTKNEKNIHKLEYYRQIGYYASDLATPIYENTFDVINMCVDVAVRTKDYVSDGLSKTIYCSMTYPGHHAKTKEYGGYCFVNNACIIAEVNSDKYDNICFFDLDYHAGDGTHEIIEKLSKKNKNKNYLSVSIHADPQYEYPSFTCYEDENTDIITNIIFPKKAGIGEYVECLKQAIDIIKKKFHEKEFLMIIPFGADTYSNDIDVSKLYGCDLEIPDYLKIGKFIRSAFKDTVIIITQEGGYFIEDVPEIVDNFITGLSTN